MAKEETKKVKRPTALKRDIRNEKRRLINKSFKSQVRTTVRSLEESLNTKNKESATTNLSAVYSMVDKCVKRGIYKANKASRIKSRLTKKAAAL